MRWCEGKLKVKIAHFLLPSASQKRAYLSSRMSSLQERKVSKSGRITIHFITLRNSPCSIFTATTVVDFKLFFFSEGISMVPLYTFPKAPWPSSFERVTSAFFTSQVSYGSFRFCNSLLSFSLQNKYSRFKKCFNVFSWSIRLAAAC